MANPGDLISYYESHRSGKARLLLSSKDMESINSQEHTAVRNFLVLQVIVAKS